MTHQAVSATKRVERRVPPELATPVTIQVTPQSVCFLYHPQTPERRIQLDADDRGIVRFHVRALNGAKPTEFHLESHAGDGRNELHTISLSSDIRYTPSMSAAELTPEPILSGKVRPALEGDPMAPSNRELVSRGYPPRPDPVKSPAPYSRWLKNVSRTFTMVSTRRVAHPEYSQTRQKHAAKGQTPAPGRRPAGQALQDMAGSDANSNFYNWTGAYYTNPTAQFAYIAADWNVPLVFTLPTGPGFSAVVEWIGLDNAGGDLYQAGTGSECFNILFWQITTYFMWMESLPWSWWEIPGFPISPGDQISVDIFVANQYGTTIYKDGTWGGLTSQDNSVWFYLNNATNGASFLATYPTAPETVGGQSSTGFTGLTAEFILERPTINGSYTDLALFLQPALMTSCSYGDAQYGGFQSFPLGANNGIPPFDGQLTYINMIDPNNNNALLAFPLSIPDPNNSADALALQFFWTNYQ